MPKEPGYYWAKESCFKWWNLIIRVYGDSPYLRYDTWNIYRDKLIPDDRRSETFIGEIGPKIEEPK